MLCDDDARDNEYGYFCGEAAGQHHSVTVKVTVQQQGMRVYVRGSVDLPGSDHETADIEPHIDDIIADGEIVDWDDEAAHYLDEIVENGEVVDWEEV
jgi:pimeloyl-CoA synthetase